MPSEPEMAAILKHDWEGVSKETVIMWLSWWLELLAVEIDEWFPDDPSPEVQSSLREVAGRLQVRLGVPNIREFVGPEMCEKFGL